MIRRLVRSRSLWGGLAALALIVGAQPTGAKIVSRVFSMVRTRVRAVALTFDDGPDADLTPRALALLDRYHARATFFVTGSHALAHPELIAAELQRGEIGNHTWNHADLSKIAPAVARTQIEETDAVLGSMLAKKPLYFRPPFGRLPRRLAVLEGHEVVRWSVAIDKYRHLSVARAARAVLGRVKPGAIILAHDSCPPRDPRAWCVSERGRSLEILDRVLARLTARGWRVVSVSELRAFATR